MDEHTSRHISFRVGKEILVGDTLLNYQSIDQPDVLCLHGAGRSDRSRYSPLRKKLLAQGIVSFAFDFSGHGESTGSLACSSLAKRTEEALGAIQAMGSTQPKTLIASSMAGHVAIKLLEYGENIENLVLFCPALYTSSSFDVPFNAGFSTIIRQEESWKDSDTFRILANFQGNLFVCIGEDDEVIPPGIVDSIDRVTKNTKNKEIFFLPKVGHQIHRYLVYNEEVLDQVLEKIAYMFVP